MKAWKTWTLMIVVSLIATGCVSQQQYDDLQSDHRRLQDQVVDLQAQLEEAESRIAALRSAGADDDQLREQLRQARAERDSLLEDLEAAEQALMAGGASVQLPEELDSHLRQLAEEHPDLMSYDSERGMVRFRSDFTFPSGSAEVRDDARQSLQELAGILQGDQASPYEIRVVGHTDNVPIGNPQTLENHPTNWHLSTNRAHSVRAVLEEAGISPQRMMAAGYGEYRPIVENEPGGTEQNRRVEIYLVAMGPDEQAEAERGAEVESGGGGGGGSQQGPSPEEMK